MLPIRAGTEPPQFWNRLRTALEDLDVQTEVVTHGMKPKPGGPLDGGSRPRQRRLTLPSSGLVRSLLGSSASTVLCVEYSPSTLTCAVLARCTDRRTIIFQENAGRAGLDLSRWDRCYRRAIALFADVFIANTDAAQVELIEVLGIRRDKVVRTMLLAPPDAQTLTAVEREVPRPANRPVFVFAGFLGLNKNVAALIDAAAVLLAREYSFEIWIVGDGPHRATLEAQAAELRDPSAIRFLGQFPNGSIGRVYEAADAFVLPSLRDYRSVAVLEAMRFGKPIIDSCYDGNVGDGVRHQVTGLVFDPHDAGALAAAMERAVLEPALFVEMGQRAAAFMAPHTPEEAASALRDLLLAPPQHERGDSAQGVVS